MNDAIKSSLFIWGLNIKINPVTLLEDNSSAISIAKGLESDEGRYLCTNFEICLFGDIDMTFPLKVAYISFPF